MLVDPVMGDDGAMYSAVPRKMPALMRKLLACADIITPNITEACLLTGREYADFSLSELPDLTKALCDLGPKMVVISGIRKDDAVYMACRENNKEYLIERPIVGASYPGSGDVFAAVLLGKLLSGMELAAAVGASADFVSLCLRESARSGAPRREGIVFEPFLGSLMEA